MGPSGDSFAFPWIPAFAGMTFGIGLGCRWVEIAAVPVGPVSMMVAEVLVFTIACLPTDAARRSFLTHEWTPMDANCGSSQ